MRIAPPGRPVTLTSRCCACRWRLRRPGGAGRLCPLRRLLARNAMLAAPVGHCAVSGGACRVLHLDAADDLPGAEPAVPAGGDTAPAISRSRAAQAPRNFLATHPAAARLRCCRPGAAHQSPGLLMLPFAGLWMLGAGPYARACAAHFKLPPWLGLALLVVLAGGRRCGLRRAGRLAASSKLCRTAGSRVYGNFSSASRSKRRAGHFTRWWWPGYDPLVAWHLLAPLALVTARRRRVLGCCCSRCSLLVWAAGRKSSIATFCRSGRRCSRWRQPGWLPLQRWPAARRCGCAPARHPAAGCGRCWPRC